MTLVQLFRAVFLAVLAVALLFGCSSRPPSSHDPIQEGPDIIIGQPIQRALVSACVTREQAELVLKAHSEKGPGEALKHFNEQHCFTALMNLVPSKLIASRRIDGKVVSIVEIIVRTGLASRHVIYMITLNRVVVGTRV